MVDQNVSMRVRKLLLDVADLEVASDDSDLLESGRIDSLALVELIYAIEEEFGVELELEQVDAEQFRTVHSIAGLVRGLQARAA